MRAALRRLRRESSTSAWKLTARQRDVFCFHTKLFSSFLFLCLPLSFPLHKLIWRHLAWLVFNCRAAFLLIRSKSGTERMPNWSSDATQLAAMPLWRSSTTTAFARPEIISFSSVFASVADSLETIKPSPNQLNSSLEGWLHEIAWFYQIGCGTSF